MRFGLFRFRSPLLTESRLLSLPVGTEMFHFPTFPPHALCVQAWVTGHDSCRVSPFGNPRIKAQSAAPRGLSQPLTSFFGSWCQGIHRAPLLTWPQRCSRPLCSSQGTGGASDAGPACRSRSGRSGVGRPDRRSTSRAVSGDEKALKGGNSAPSGPNSVPTRRHVVVQRFRRPRGPGTDCRRPRRRELVSVPPMSDLRETLARVQAFWAERSNVRRPSAP